MVQAKLSREVGVVLLLFYGLGNILGAGIYVLVGKVIGIAGYFSVFSFLLACAIAIFTAFSYMELASRYPVSAGAAVYIKEGLGSIPLSLVFGLLMATAALISAATIAHGFAGYVGQLIEVDKEVAMLLLICALVVIAISSIKISVVFASVLTVFEIIGLLMIIYYGFDKITNPMIAFSEFVPSFKVSDISILFLGTFLAFYAFLGFEDMVNIAEEVKEPSKAFPIAIVLALFIATLLYILIVLVALETLSLEELKNSNAPFADIYKSLTGAEPLLISMIGSVAVINGALIQIIMASRIIYGMASNGWLPSFLSKVSLQTKTPIVSTLFVGLVTIVFSFVFDIVALASYTSMLILVVFILVNISLIKIKLSGPVPKGIVEIPLWVPLCGVGLNFFLLIMQLSFTG